MHPNTFLVCSLIESSTGYTSTAHMANYLPHEAIQ